MAGVTPKQIWDALEKAGASSVQAVGIMANAIAESSLDPEARAMDTNGYYSNGLWQFNEDSYPSAGELVTGNPGRDMLAQVQFLIQNGGLQAASGTTVDETAGNFASQFERCATCTPGGTSYEQRVGNAATVAGWAATGSWPSSTGSASDTATLTAAQGQAVKQGQAECLWAIGENGIPGTSIYVRILSLGSASGNIGAGSFCIFSKSQARAMIGAGLLVGGILITAAGLAMVLKAAAVTQLAGVASVASRVAGPVAAVAGPEAGVAAAATSAARPRQGTRADSTGTSPEFRSAFL
jgi:hypothetical protein